MPRRNFSPATKRAAHKRSAGNCESCGLPHHNLVEYDHDREDTFGGEPTIENCVVMCVGCHKSKTKKNVSIIAKSNRVRDKNHGIRSPRTITRWRRFSGEIVIKPRERT